ncbi:MAG: DUF3576 domain-containing protein [Parvibaculales bacterium]
MFRFSFQDHTLSLKKTTLALAFMAPFLLTACGGADPESSYPSGPGETVAEAESGGLFSNGFSFFGGNDAPPQNTGSIGVNGYLWRATLDAISFLPLSSADPFGGVIISDWYSEPQNPNERTKVTIYILDKRLRADGLRVSIFKQTRQSGGEWTDAAASNEAARKLENLILTRAREMRIANVDAGE